MNYFPELYLSFVASMHSSRAKHRSPCSFFMTSKWEHRPVWLGAGKPAARRAWRAAPLVREGNLISGSVWNHETLGMPGAGRDPGREADGRAAAPCIDRLQGWGSGGFLQGLLKGDRGLPGGCRAWGWIRHPSQLTWAAGRRCGTRFTVTEAELP